ncbi:hypothetical protein OAH97_01800 [Octadecabacter sp.]|nr:hypothetical protein [Octadecabacter sp.]
MSGQSKKNSKDTSEGAALPSVDALATQALSLVAKRIAVTAQEFNIDIAIQLRDAAAESSTNRVPEIIDDMLASGISVEMVACEYIPHAARQMGDDWCDDTLTFARVTIGTARLQSSLRSLGDDWASHGYADQDTPNAGLIVIVAKDAFHTLGAMVLCGQLRRMGLSVRLVMGASLAELRTIFESTVFDAALISASVAESLDSLRECTDLIKEASYVCPPIIIGGNVIDQDADVLALTGADYLTKDPFEALDHCGIKGISRAHTSNQERRT